MALLRELSATEQRAALEAAVLCLIDSHSDEESFLQLREAISAGLAVRGWYFSDVGSLRERELTLQVGRALGLTPDLSAIELWDQDRSRTFNDLVAAFDKAIEYLK